MTRSIVNDQNIPFSKQYLKFTTCVLVSLLRANISFINARHNTCVSRVKDASMLVHVHMCVFVCLYVPL